MSPYSVASPSLPPPRSSAPADLIVADHLVIEFYQPCSRTQGAAAHNPGCSQGFGSNLITGCEHQETADLGAGSAVLPCYQGSSVRVRGAHRNLIQVQATKCDQRPLDSRSWEDFSIEYTTSGFVLRPG